jgi:hypothetical protein
MRHAHASCCVMSPRAHRHTVSSSCRADVASGWSARAVPAGSNGNPSSSQDGKEWPTACAENVGAQLVKESLAGGWAAAEQEMRPEWSRTNLGIKISAAPQLSHIAALPVVTQHQGPKGCLLSWPFDGQSVAPICCGPSVASFRTRRQRCVGHLEAASVASTRNG